MNRHKKVRHMTPPVLVSLVNLSKRVTDAEVTLIASAIGKQAAQHVSPVHGLVPAIEAVPTGGKPSASGVPLWITDKPDVDGALGYHDEDAQGQAFIKVFVDPVLDNGGSVLSGSNSVAAVCSHELSELIGDSAANKWADGPDGSDVAWELCDPVEGDSYEIDVDGTAVSVSNFVFPAYFDPHAESGSRFDYMGKLGRPFTMTSGGYLITRTEPGKVTNIFGSASQEAAAGMRLHFGSEFPDWKRKGKLLKAEQRRKGR
jgi:hypothetical protein